MSANVSEAANGDARSPASDGSLPYPFGDDSGLKSKRGRKPLNFMGKLFGTWEVTRRVAQHEHTTKAKCPHWELVCRECGAKTIRRSTNLTKGTCKQCTCQDTTLTREMIGHHAIGKYAKCTVEELRHKIATTEEKLSWMCEALQRMTT